MNDLRQFLEVPRRGPTTNESHEGGSVGHEPRPSTIAKVRRSRNEPVQYRRQLQLGNVALILLKFLVNLLDNGGDTAVPNLHCVHEDQVESSRARPILQGHQLCRAPPRGNR